MSNDTTSFSFLTNYTSDFNVDDSVFFAILFLIKSLASIFFISLRVHMKFLYTLSLKDTKLESAALHY